MENENAFKNLINEDVVRKISIEILRVHPKFDAKNFSKVSHLFPQLELRGRALAISDSLKLCLPTNYVEALNILVKVIKNKKLSGFSLWGFSEFIGQHGLDHFDESLKAMYVLTQHFTAEFAVRPFFQKDHHTVLGYFEKWSTDPNVHIRRWVSEGSRPLLPWGLRLNVFKDQPELSVALLHKLKHDEELYVRKSVANHLNDISKFNPKLVIKTLKLWEQNCGSQHSEKLNWIRRHSLRTLIKKGHPDALKLMGVSIKPDIKLEKIILNKSRLKLGENLNFSVKLKSISKKTQDIILDYVIYFRKSNGTTTGKVFKLKSFSIPGTESIVIEKNHSLKPITTMKFYSGTHFLSVKVNGIESKKIKWNFQLTKP